jgi:hypothetical protein
VQPAVDDSTTAAMTAFKAAAERFGNVIYQPLSCLSRPTCSNAEPAFELNVVLTS